MPRITKKNQSLLACAFTKNASVTFIHYVAKMFMWWKLQVIWAIQIFQKLREKEGDLQKKGSKY